MESKTAVQAAPSPHSSLKWFLSGLGIVAVTFAFDAMCVGYHGVLSGYLAAVSFLIGVPGCFIGGLVSALIARQRLRVEMILLNLCGLMGYVAFLLATS